MSGVWAIARNLVVEIMRMRILVVFIILLTACYTIFFALWLQDSTGRADEKIQTFLSYSLSFTAGFLALLTIFISIATISNDIKRKEIFTIASKPLSRERYLLGKFLGMAMLNFVLLFVSLTIIYGLARYLQRTEPISTDDENRLKELIFVARRAVKPEVPDISAAVNRKVEAIVAAKLRDEPEKYKNNPMTIGMMRSELTMEFTKELIIAQRAVPPGGHIVWHFTGIDPVDHDNGYIYIRYNQDISQYPPDNHLINQWAFGPKDPVLHGGDMMPPKRDAVKTVHEFPIPISAVSDEGDLYVVYRNHPNNRPVTVIFKPDTGIEALYVAGGFEVNFLRTGLLLYLRLIFLSTLGLAVGAWLSFPVAVLSVLVIYVMGLCSGFLTDAMKWETGQMLRSFSSVVISIFPEISTYDPVPQIEKGRLVSNQLLLNCAVFMVLLKGGVIALFGYLIFKFRELARVIV